MKSLFYLFLLVFLTQCKPKQDNINIEFPAKAEVPSSIKNSHENLLEKINKITTYKDSSRTIALKTEELMLHHFKEEEDFILPLLGLLPSLANEQKIEQTKNVILLSQKVKENLNHMSAEHQLIKAYINELKQACANENLPEIIEFENYVIKHAKSEEEVYFPAAILVGEYLKLKAATTSLKIKIKDF